MILFRQLCTSSVRRSAHRGQSVWRPAVFTLLVGGVSYSVSGLYAAELKLSQSTRYLRLYHRDDLVSRVRRWWWSIGAVNRFTISVVSLNSVVFLLWRVPVMHRVMEKYFLSSITSKSTLPLLLSEFSHMELWHLGLNMLVLWSFTPTLMRTLGDERSSFNTWPYYLTGGVFASVVGYYSKLLKRVRLGSMGASGALMAVVSLVVLNNPDATVYIIFLPFIPIPATWALGSVVAMDMLGVIRGWQFFDHAGHLGGVLFAGLYHWWLYKVLNKLQFTSARTWFRLRSESNK